MLAIKRLCTITLLLLSPIAACLNLKVSITGAEYNLAPKLEKQILSDLSIYNAINEPKLTSTRIETLHYKAIKQIITTLESLGYYHAQIKDNLNKENETWHANYKINIGTPTRITKISITSDINIKISNLPIKIKQNNIFNHAEYEESKTFLLSNLHEQGYLNAQFIKNIVQINRENHQAEIILDIVAGAKYTFGEIKFIGSDYSSLFLKRYIPFSYGDSYSVISLRQLRKNMEDSNLFSKIRLDPKPDLNDPKNNIVPVTVRLVPKANTRYSGSLGYGTDTGIRGGLSWLNRHVTDYGHQMNASINASQIRKLANINYIIPGKLPATDSYVLGSSIQEENFDDKYSRKEEIIGTKVIHRGSTKQHISIQYFTEFFRLLPTDPKKYKKFLIPSVKYIWLNSSNKNDFCCGTQLDLRARGGANAILSSANFLQIEAHAKHIAPILDLSRIIIKSSLGTTTTNKFKNLTPSLRFFAGGDQSVRGYKYRSLGPKETDLSGKEVVTGGKHIFLASIELERKILEKTGVAIFIDSGNAMNKFSTKLAVGSGIGMRWTTPIGAFHIDLAKPLNKSEKKNIRIHLTFGADF